MDVPSSNLVFTTSAPNVVLTEFIPNKVDLTFSTFAPILSIAFFPNNKNLIFSTSSPILQINLPLIIPSINLTISSTSPSGVANKIRIPNKVNLTITTSPPVLDLFVKTRFKIPKSPVVAVELDLYLNKKTTIRFWSGDDTGLGLLRLDDDNNLVQFDPRLLIPIQIGSEITSEQYGELVRGVGKGGLIEFLIDESVWSYLSYHWLGRNVRVYEGNSGDRFDDMNLIYTGRIDNLSYDEVKANVKLTDASLDLDKPLVSDFYDETALESIRGRPKPYLRGEVYSVEPVLEDDVNQVYRLSWNKALDEIIEIRIGGVVWNETSAATPGSGEWKGDLANGTFSLGSSTLGQEVRCDVKAGTYSSVDLITEIVESFGGSIDTAVLKNCNKAAPGEIGFFAKDPINVSDVLDQISFGAGALWEFEFDGKIRIRAIEKPDSDLKFRKYSMIELGEDNIDSLTLSDIIPPIWRLRVEYKRNWQPLTNILPGVTDADKARFTSTGIVAEAFQDLSIKFQEPRAVDAPLIRTLFVHEDDAIVVRDRLKNAWMIEGRIYDIVCWIDQVPELYDTLKIDFKMVSGYFRIHSILRNVGGGPTALRVWGLGNAYPEGILLEDQSGFILEETGDIILMES